MAMTCWLFQAKAPAYALVHGTWSASQRRIAWRARLVVPAAGHKAGIAEATAAS
jgi:hypothetical protein